MIISFTFFGLEFLGAEIWTKKWQKSVQKPAQNDRISASVARPLDRKIAELGQNLQGFCLILAQLAYFCKVFA